MKKIVTTRRDELLTYVNKLKCFFNATDKELFNRFYQLGKEIEEKLVDSEMSEKEIARRRRCEINEKLSSLFYHIKSCEDAQWELYQNNCIENCPDYIKELRKEKESLENEILTMR